MSGYILLVTGIASFYKCEVIYENPPYEGTNSVIQISFIHMFVIVFVVNTAQGVTKMLPVDVF